MSQLDNIAKRLNGGARLTKGAYDEAKHLRGFHGRWVGMGGHELKMGDHVHVPSGPGEPVKHHGTISARFTKAGQDHVMIKGASGGRSFPAHEVEHMSTAEEAGHAAPAAKPAKDFKTGDHVHATLTRVPTAGHPGGKYQEKRVVVGHTDNGRVLTTNHKGTNTLSHDPADLKHAKPPKKDTSPKATIKHVGHGANGHPAYVVHDKHGKSTRRAT